MTISSRIPEGFPSRCPLCGAETNLEFSEPAGDAPCPQCGRLLWKSSQVLDELRRMIAETLSLSPEELGPDTSLEDLHADSISVVELVMRVEDSLPLEIPDEDYEQIRTIGDLVRYILRRQSDD